MVLSDDLQHLADQVRDHSNHVSKEVDQELRRVLENAKLEINIKRKLLTSYGDSAGITFDFFSYEYLLRLAFVAVLALTTGFLNAFSSVLAGYRNPQIVITGPYWAKGSTTLPDLGHDIVQFFTQRLLGTDFIDWFELPDIFVSVMGTSFAIFMLLHPRWFLILRRLTFIFSWLNLLRSLTVICTSLPDASPECAKQFGLPNSYKDQLPYDAIFNSLRRSIKKMMYPSNVITCGDMVFSGHTSFLTLVMLVFRQYCRKFRGAQLLRIAVYATYCIAIFAIIGTKLHYTIDVALAIWITHTCFSIYHHGIESKTILRQVRQRK